MANVSAHCSSGMWPRVSGGDEDAGRDRDGVEAAIGQDRLVEHRADAGALGDVAGRPMAGPQPEMPLPATPMPSAVACR